MKKKGLTTLIPSVKVISPFFFVIENSDINKFKCLTLARLFRQAQYFRVRQRAFSYTKAYPLRGGIHNTPFSYQLTQQVEIFGPLGFSVSRLTDKKSS